MARSVNFYPLKLTALPPLGCGVTEIPEKRLLWISEEPFKASEWPLLSMSYRLESRSIREATRELARPYTAVVLDFPAASWRAAEALEIVQKAAAGVPIL